MDKLKKNFILKEIIEQERIREEIQTENTLTELERLMRIPTKAQVILSEIEKILEQPINYEKEVKEIEKIINILRDKILAKLEE